MTKIVSVLFSVILVIFTSGFANSWHYGDESHWPETCRNGKSQSPINLNDQISVKESFDKFVFSNYNIELPATVKNSGHSVQVNYSSVPPPIVKGGGLSKEYTLDHLHFHWPSEHTINNHRFPLEVHLVHYGTEYKNLSNALNYADGVAVLGVFYDYSPDDDVEFEPLIKVVENIERSPNVEKPAEKTKINSFIPRDTAGFYRYDGSLTTPNCNEVVIWTLFTNTIHLSKEQIHHFESVYSDEGNALKSTYRSLQELKGRKLYQKVSPIPYSSSATSLFNISFLHLMTIYTFILYKLCL